MGTSDPRDSDATVHRSRSDALALRRQLAPEAVEGPLEGVAHGAADEQEVDEGREHVALLELVVELERHLDAVRPRREGDALAAAQLLVLDLERLARAGLV